MPSLFALLHFNTQSHTKLPAKDLMQSLLYFRAIALTEWKKLNKGCRAGWQTTLFSITHTRDFAEVTLIMQWVWEFFFKLEFSGKPE